MLLTLFGATVALVPFCLILTFKNKFLGLLYVSLGLVAFHLFLAFVTQLSHIFSYTTIITANSLLAAATVWFTLKKGWNLKITPPNWIIILGFIVIFFQLWSVHHFYTGTISTINGFEQVSKISYPFPYFSDEWIGAAMSNYSIAHNSLPLVNPLTNGKKITNPLVMFFAFISEIILLLNLNPLTGYTTLALISGFFICLLGYALLYANNVNKFSALLAAIFITYITNGANLPGIWYLLPYSMGLIMFLIGLTLLSLSQIRAAVLAGFLAIIFYPPIVIFAIPAIFAWACAKIKFSHVAKYSVLSILILLITAVLIIGLAINHFNIVAIVHAARGYLIRTSAEGGLINIMPWDVMPLLALPFVLIGLIKIFRDKLFYLAAPIIVGIIFWIAYLFTDKVFIIEYPRVAVITSIILVIITGFGMDWLWQTSPKILNNKTFIYLTQAAVMLAVIFLSFSYTNKSAWANLTLRPSNSTQTLQPAAPANRYLTADDLGLFKNISQKKFIAPPWKGLVLAVATNNFPLESKASIISNKVLTYVTFASANCSEKQQLAQKFKIDYAYSATFNCPGFNLIDSSTEGLYLYKIDK